MRRPNQGAPRRKGAGLSPRRSRVGQGSVGAEKKARGVVLSSLPPCGEKTPETRYTGGRTASQRGLSRGSAMTGVWWLSEAPGAQLPPSPEP